MSIPWFHILIFSRTNSHTMNNVCFDVAVLDAMLTSAWRVLSGAGCFSFTSSLCIHICQCELNRLKEKLLDKRVCFTVKWISKAKQNWANSVHETGTFQTIRFAVHVNSSFSHMFAFLFLFTHHFEIVCIALNCHTISSVASEENNSSTAYAFQFYLITALQLWFAPCKQHSKVQKTHAIKQQKRNSTIEPFGKWSFLTANLFSHYLFFAFRDESSQTLYHIWSSYRIMNGLNLNGQWTTEYHHIHWTLQFGAILSEHKMACYLAML